MKPKDLASVTPPDPDQIMMAGIAPVSMGERLGWLAAQPMQPRREQRPLDIGFWNPMRDQLEMSLLPRFQPFSGVFPMTLQTVKLSQLRLSPLNVRRVKPKAIDQLAADMLAHGQLQNLVVYAEGNRFEVAAGGRRYRAFKQLEKAKAISASHPVSVDVRDKAEAVELSLAENVSREDMHVADAVIAYGDLRTEGKSPEDIAARFGVALSYVKKVLRLSALHPDALACLARDQIGMEAAQALTLTDDHDRQLDALKRFGNSANQIRRMLTEEKIGTSHGLYLFVGHDAYAAAGGTITADLFAENGDGYADAPELVEALATAKMAEVELGYRGEGWRDVRASLERPDDYYNLVTVHAEGKREPTEAEQAERARIQEAAEARLAELGKGNQWGDRVFNGLEREARTLENRLCVFTDAQKTDSAMVLFVGNSGEIEAKAIRTKRIAKGGNGDAPAIKPDQVASACRLLRPAQKACDRQDYGRCAGQGRRRQLRQDEEERPCRCGRRADGRAWMAAARACDR
ncbi:hypothetical protein CDQ92_15145 [Sphingopyxis bauzanensis]|uniref:ParB-like N-terminal domain-containing protein n=1 Tax=Sphingopyxis bauzanensis TaxID=651663 RepID=A0A246JU63_9SPHN|nr:ParB/RepB/Spo0J family partition protein [Sphingopyxis bauzanensis]OWQ96062.1 hypothetical protein CDQ92_15145 [Sphingopyxis bauzanensis]